MAVAKTKTKSDWNPPQQHTNSDNNQQLNDRCDCHREIKSTSQCPLAAANIT
jgi:hypothetical protein